MTIGSKFGIFSSSRIIYNIVFWFDTSDESTLVLSGNEVQRINEVVSSGAVYDIESGPGTKSIYNI